MKSFFSHALPEDPQALEAVIGRGEQEAGPLKPGAQAQIIWANANRKNKTPVSIVYLHGFSGSRGEGDPVHKTIARNLGCNLYLSRLYGHGQQQQKNFADLSPQKLIKSAENALRIGQKIGERVIVMGTSTGGSLALYGAASAEFSESIAGLILYSPLIHLYGIKSLLLENRPIRTLLRILPGRNYEIQAADSIPDGHQNIWYHSYCLNGALALGKMTQNLMRPSLYKKVTCPVFIGYYYKNQYAHDRVVSTSAIQRMASKLESSPKVQLKNFPAAGTHVICSSLLSAVVHNVIASTMQFMNKELAIHPIY